MIWQRNIQMQMTERSHNRYYAVPLIVMFCYVYTNFVDTAESGAATYDRSPIRGFFRPDLLSFAVLQTVLGLRTSFCTTCMFSKDSQACS